MNLGLAQLLIILWAWNQVHQFMWAELFSRLFISKQDLNDEEIPIFSCERESRRTNADSRRKMKKFDPWPVFFRREWKRNWPFLVGFAITGTLITKMTAGLSGMIIDCHSLLLFLLQFALRFWLEFESFTFTCIDSFVDWFSEEEVKNSPFVQRHNRYFLGTLIYWFGFTPTHRTSDLHMH